MSGKELVESFIAEIEKGNFSYAISEYLSDDFKIEFPIPLPINIGKGQISMVFDLVKNSVPDFKLNFVFIEENESSIKGKVKFSGLFKVNFSIPGLSNIIPATGKEINLPETNIEFKVSEKINSLSLQIPNFQELIGSLMSNANMPNMGNLSDMAKNAGINIPFKF